MKALNEIKKYSLIAIVLCAAIGLLFLMFPAQCIKYISLAVGIVFIIMGVAGIIGFVSNKKGSVTLVLGIISALTGTVICIKYQAIISIIVVIIGVFFVVTGAFNFFTGIKIIASSLVSGWATLIMSIVTFIFGIIAVTKSNQLTVGVVQFIGVSLILYAVLGLVSFFQVKKLFKNAQNAINASNDIEVEATETELDN